MPRRHVDGREHGAFKPEDSAWMLVKRRHWWRRERHSSPQRPQPPSNGHRPHSRRQGGRPSHPPLSASHRAFWAETSGRCFICLGKDHRAAQCRDPIRCFSCRRSGHRARECRRQLPEPTPHRRSLPPRRSPPATQPRAPPPPPPRKSSPAARQPVRPTTARLRQASAAVLPPPPPRLNSTPMAQLGDPATRPEEDFCYIPTS